MTFKIKKICCLGAGYVGGPTMAVIAYKCPDLIINVVDVNKRRIECWNSEDLNQLPIYEQGLKSIIKSCRNKNLFFTDKIESNIAEADLIFITVNTPTKKTGFGAGKASDTKWIELASRQIAKFAKGKTIVVEKSTSPVKTAEIIKKILNESNKMQNYDKSLFSVLSNPEFMSEGSAIDDLINPDRILIGGEDQESINALEEIYLKWIDKEKILKTNLWSSELSKLTANAFLAQRISSINSISAICELTGANINEVSRAIGMDTRIGAKFLSSGPGFGGSCFQKDILNLIYIAGYYGLHEVSSYWSSIINLNNWQQTRISQIIVQNLFGTVTGKKIAILGFAFKANTNDTRESPAIRICKNLIEEGAQLNIYDPQVDPKQISQDLDYEDLQNDGIGECRWFHADSIYEASMDADAIVVLTEWEEFKYIDWEKLILIMRQPSWIFDTRNITKTDKAEIIGFNIWKVGQNQISFS